MPKGVARPTQKLPKRRDYLYPFELRVIGGILQDKSDKEIAASLGVTLSTVKGYQIEIKRVLGVRSRVGVALWAARQERFMPDKVMHTDPGDYLVMRYE